MEQNLPILTKKLWNIAKLAFLMLRKGVSKKKLLIKLNLMMQQQEQSSNLKYGRIKQPPREFEFSCSNTTPLYVHYLNKRSKNQQYLQEYDFCMESPNVGDIIDMKSLDAIDNILETIVQSNKYGYVRELKVTDSPFSVRNVEDSDQRVDEYAEEFIKSFYDQLKEQTC